jgi:predicted nucleotide-binding protein
MRVQATQGLSKSELNEMTARFTNDGEVADAATVVNRTFDKIPLATRTFS